MARQTRRAVRRDRLPVLLHDHHRVVRVAAGAAHRARRGDRRVAVAARGAAVLAEGDREAHVVVRRRGLRRYGEPARRRAGHRPDVHHRHPRERAVAHGAVARERGARRRREVRVDPRALHVLLVARVAVRRRVGEALLVRAHVALAAVREHVHAGEREPRHPVELEGARDLPARGHVALVARRPEAPEVEVLVARHAVALDRRVVVALHARRGHVLSGQREAGRRVIELATAAGRRAFDFHAVVEWHVPHDTESVRLFIPAGRGGVRRRGRHVARLRHLRHERRPRHLRRRAPSSAARPAASRGAGSRGRSCTRATFAASGPWASRP